MKFADPYDFDLAKTGPAGLFTLTHDGSYSLIYFVHAIGDGDF